MSDSLLHKFIRRETTADDESSLMQNLPREAWQNLLRQRAQADLERHWQHLAEVAPAIARDLDSVEGWDNIPDALRRFGSGLAVLIEEIHHLNACAAQRRRDQRGG